MSKRRTRAALVSGGLVVVGVVASVWVIGCGLVPDESDSAPPAQRPRVPQVRVAVASRARIARGLDLTGSVEPCRVAQLASPAEGPVAEVRVREGDAVRAGQALLAIGRRRSAEASVAALREELAKEEENLRRSRALVESEAIAGEDLERARAAFEAVRSQLIRAEETVLDYTIAAPWAGVVSRVDVKEGQFVAPRAALLEMYDPSSLAIRAAVPESQAARVAVAMPVEVRLDAFPGDVFSGRIVRTYPYLDPRLRTRTIEIVLDQNAALLPGMFARLRVVMEAADQAVVVPSTAIVAAPGGPALFVVEEGRVLRRAVRIGIEAGDRVQIVAGVEPGDQVVVAGHEQLTDGAAVRPSGASTAGKGDAPGADPPAGARSQAEGDRR